MNESKLNQAVAIDDLASEQDRKAIGKAMPGLYRTLIHSIVLNKTKQRPSNGSDRYKVLIAKNKTRTLILGYLIAEIISETVAEKGAAVDRIKIAKIVYVWVKPMWRKLHIAKSLINKLEQNCKASSIIKLTILFNTSNEAMHALTKNDDGWSNAEHLVGYTFSSRSSMYPLLKDLKRTSQRLKLKAKTSVLAEDNYQSLIDCSQSSTEIPSWARLSQETLQSASQQYSRVLYEDQEIVGWLITFPLANQTLDYRILWLDHQHRNRGIALKALTEIMCQAHFQDHHGTLQTKDHGYPWPRGFFLVHSENQAMGNFAKKRLTRGSDEQTRFVYHEKPLTTCSGQNRTEPWR